MFLKTCLGKWHGDKQCIPRSDCSLGAVWSGSTLFAVPSVFRNDISDKKLCFLRDEVLAVFLFQVYCNLWLADRELILRVTEGSGVVVVSTKIF